MTGLIVRDTATEFTPLGQTIILILIQLGGLGIILFGALFAVIFGGSISAAYDLFETSLHKGLESFAYRRVIERLVMAPSTLEDSAVLGAAALYVDAMG